MVSVAFIDGTLNVRKYIDTILEPKLLPSIRGLFTNNASFIFNQDSATCHTVKKSKDWYRYKIIELLSWSGNSPETQSYRKLVAPFDNSCPNEVSMK
ncbi:transposable element Tcb1 transposase [Trichonephila clavipes]|nr:transposable element Tcb1 transposase [Trichonephila clavipes]